jgi:hypothetical protein
MEELAKPKDGRSMRSTSTAVDAQGNYALTAGTAFGPSDFAWSYQANPPESLFAEAISGAQRLPNGNTLIDDGTHGTFIEVTPGGETVWKYVNPVVRTGPLTQGDAIPLDPARAGELMNAVFRVYRYGPDFPGLAGRDLTPGLPVERYPDPARAKAYLPLVTRDLADASPARRAGGEALDHSQNAGQVAVASLGGLVELVKTAIISPVMGAFRGEE